MVGHLRAAHDIPHGSNCFRHRHSNHGLAHSDGFYPFSRCCFRPRTLPDSNKNGSVFFNVGRVIFRCTGVPRDLAKCGISILPNINRTFCCCMYHLVQTGTWHCDICLTIERYDSAPVRNDLKIRLCSVIVVASVFGMNRWAADVVINVTF